ncbi:MAG: class I SAM-dependent methyltransferase [Acidimicrobiales bacterium]
MADASTIPAQHYDRVTSAWGYLLGDDLHYGVFARGDETLAEATAALTAKMVRGARIEPGVEVLDVGCGTGAPACALASDHGARVTGITTSAVGVQAARQRAESLGLAGYVHFEERDGMANGYPDASFDRVWVLESSHLMSPRHRVVAECARVLRPGGVMALCDIVLKRPLAFSEVRRLREPLTLLRQVFGDAHMEPLDTYAALAEEHGLVVDVIEDLTEATRPTFDRWRRTAEAHRDEVVELLDETDWQRFVDSCAVLEGLWDDGTLGYGLIAAHRPPIDSWRER